MGDTINTIRLAYVYFDHHVLASRRTVLSTQDMISYAKHLILYIYGRIIYGYNTITSCCWKIV